MPHEPRSVPDPLPPSGPSGPAWSWPTRLFIGAWIVFLLLPPAMLLRVRGEWLAELEGREAQENWEEFRRDMRGQSGGDGPVQRKVPKSGEPPLRVWLRDHVALAITAWVVLGGTLGAFLGVMVSGATSPGPGAGGGVGHSPNMTPAVPATTTNSTNAMPRTPSSENTARTSEDDG